MNLGIYEFKNIRIKEKEIPDSQIGRFANCHSRGLTLIELLVVMVIMGILATVGFGQYRTSQIKARDAQRKGDLDNVSRALEMYYNDHESYPTSSDGKIQVGADVLNWGTAFDTDDVVYMKTLPSDPVSDYDYCYESDADGSYYKLYAKLENENDDDYGSYTCNGDTTYSYGVSSSNTTL